MSILARLLLLDPFLQPMSIRMPRSHGLWMAPISTVILQVPGSISITPEGNWTYSLDNSLDATQQLEEGEFQPDSFTARVTDEHGASAIQTISISVSGTNDIPSLTNQLLIPKELLLKLIRT